MNQFLTFSKGVLFLMAATLLATLAYLAATNPGVNSREKARITEERERAAKAELEELQEWVHSESSDVDVSAEQYPVVVLRDSFKVLRITAESALVGWRYEVVNTSPKQEYTVDVRYIIQDHDGFDVVEGNGSVVLKPQKYNEISGTVIVGREDVRRLAGSTWTIRLSPDWKSSEAKTEGTRYERLTYLLQENIDIPLWVRQRAIGEDAALLRLFSDKWNAIAAAYAAPEPSAGDNEST